MVTFFYENCKIMKSNKLKSRTRLVYTVNNNDFALPVPFSFFNNWFTFLAVFFTLLACIVFPHPKERKSKLPYLKHAPFLELTTQFNYLYYIMIFTVYYKGGQLRWKVVAFEEKKQFSYHFYAH